MKDNLGDRMKAFESQEADKHLLPFLPTLARLDGKGFSKFTKGLARPYDERLSKLMIETTRYLVAETNAVCGFVQSDEITLAWHTPPRSENLVYFNGRIQKMTSLLAAECSVKFNQLLPSCIPEKIGNKAIFDCRVWVVPTLEEGVNVFYWRELDATKNSISMAANSYYSHKELVKKTGPEKIVLLQQKGVTWEDYPNFFKRGTYVQRKTITRKFNLQEIANLPVKHEARTNPDLVVTRNDVMVVDLPPLSKISNRVDVIFHGGEPILH